MPHLLIVEDSALVIDALRLLFEHHGYRVSAANTIADGVGCAIADPPDVVLLDLTLPDGDGLELLETLRQRNALPPGVIALTGNDDEIRRTQCLDAGCRMVLVKPVPTQALLALVRSL